MNWKKIAICWLTIILLSMSSSQVRADECDQYSKGSQELIDCYDKKVKESQGQQKTLASAISYLDNQIYLALAEIEQTEAELDKLEEEIATLTVKIDRLDINLTDVSKLLVSRVGAAYKRQFIKPMFVFLSSNGFANYLQNNQYIQLAQQNDRKVLLELQNSRDQHQEQKDLKEDKQKEVEELQQQLSSQKIALGGQKQEKQSLLEITKNDEKRYQALLTEAKRQKAAFQSYVASQGGASILSNQTKCDSWGCYYNQRDSSWGNSIIGLSGDSSMKEYGCLVTSMAMIASHYGKNLNPGQIASSSNPFFGSTAYMLLGTWSVNGMTTTRTRLGSSTSNIDDELNAGRPVIVGIYGGPDHFLVIKGKENGEYIMHDPFPENGANLKFTDKYPLSAISQVDRVTM